MLRGFRVYDKQEKRMIAHPTVEAGIVLAASGRLVMPSDWRLYLMDRYVRMDETGLHDKNGVPIFEGDCLGGSWGDGWIAWCDKCKSFEYFCKDCGCMSCSGDIAWSEIVQSYNLEVIGNIHQHPELIKSAS